MRIVKEDERKKRGCIYCLDYKTHHGYKKCKHDKCPYRELDNYESYEDYFRSRPGISIEEILKKGWGTNELI